MTEGYRALEQYRINKLRMRYGLKKEDWKLTKLNYGTGSFHEPAKFIFRMKERSHE